MARNIGAEVTERLATIFFHHPKSRDCIGHDRGLGIFRQGQLVERSLTHQLEQILLQRVIDFLENFPGGAAGLGERLAHADCLAPLPRKNKCTHMNPHCYICRVNYARLSGHASAAA